MIARSTRAVLLAGIILGLGGPALAQTGAGAATPTATVSTPAPAEPARPAFAVAGFRSASFGMKEDKVRAAIKADFPDQAGAIKEGGNDVDRTRSLSITVPSLEPGPGAATIVYVLGASSKELMHVNVMWQRPATATEDERRALVTSGLQLVNYFRGFSWAENKEAVAVPIGPNAVLLFAAHDARKGGVQVRGDGVRYDMVGQDGKVNTSPEPNGVATLTISYSRNVEKPDVYRIPAGRF